MAGERRAPSARLAPHVHDFAHRRLTVCRAPVQRADLELEAPGRALFQGHDERVEAPARACRPRRCRRRRSPSTSGARRAGAEASASAGRDVEQRVLNRHRKNPSREVGQRPRPHPRRCDAGPRSPRGRSERERSAPRRRQARTATTRDRTARCTPARTPPRPRARRCPAASRCAPRRRRASPAIGRKSKTAPPPLSTTTNVGSSPSRRTDTSAPTSWASATSPRWHTTRRPGRGHAERRRHGSVDPVRAPVGERPRRLVGRRPERLGVADRHRGGDEDDAIGAQPAEFARDDRVARARSPARRRSRPRPRRRPRARRPPTPARARGARPRAASRRGRPRAAPRSRRRGRARRRSGASRPAARRPARPASRAAAWTSAGRRPEARPRGASLPRTTRTRSSAS